MSFPFLFRFLLISVLVCQVSSCFRSVEGDNSDTFGDPKVFVFGTDYTSGQLKWIGEEKTSFSNYALDIHSDSRLDTYGNFLYVIERLGADNIMKIDPRNSGEASVIYQTHLGDLVNPMDMAFVSETKAYIALEAVPYILEFNPRRGSILDSIDISEYIFQPEEGEGVAATTPHAHALEIMGGDLYVFLQRRNGDWEWSGGRGLVLKIDTETNKITDTQYTLRKNPTTLKIVGGKILIGCLGSFFDTEDGSIEWVNFSEGESTLLWTEEEMGGNMPYFSPIHDDLFYVMHTPDYDSVQVSVVDLSKGTIEKTLPGIIDAGEHLWYDAEKERLYITERDPENSGVLIFEAGEDSPLGVLPMDVPPSQFQGVAAGD